MIIHSEIKYTEMRHYNNSLKSLSDFGNFVLDSGNLAFRNENDILDKIYERVNMFNPVIIKIFFFHNDI